MYKLVMTQDELNQQLFTASQKRNVDKIECCLQQGAEINGRDPAGWTALHYAARQGVLEAVEFLLDNGADINSKNNAGYTPLLHAVQNGHFNCIKYFVEHGANLDEKINGQNVLHRAIVHNYIPCVKYFIALGIDPLAKDDNGGDAMDFARKYALGEVFFMVDAYYQSHKLHEMIKTDENQQGLEF